MMAVKLGNYYYGQSYPKKLTELAGLLLTYGLHQKMEICCSHRARAAEIIKYNSNDYIKFLCSICPDQGLSIVRRCSSSMLTRIA